MRSLITCLYFVPTLVLGVATAYYLLDGATTFAIFMGLLFILAGIALWCFIVVTLFIGLRRLF